MAPEEPLGSQLAPLADKGTQTTGGIPSSAGIPRGPRDPVTDRAMPTPDQHQPPRTPIVMMGQ